MEGEPDNGFCKLFAVLCLKFFFSKEGKFLKKL